VENCPEGIFVDAESDSIDGNTFLADRRDLGRTSRSTNTTATEE
jgi:hypothetical protein